MAVHPPDNSLGKTLGNLVKIFVTQPTRPILQSKLLKRFPGKTFLTKTKEEGRRESRFLSSPPSLVSVRTVVKVVVETVVTLLKLCFNIAFCAWLTEGHVVLDL